MITDIEMSFRHLRAVALRELTGVNIIVGPNNAGKTSIFRGVQAMSSKGPFQEGDYLKLGTRMGFSQTVAQKLRHPAIARLFTLQGYRGDPPREITHWRLIGRPKRSEFIGNVWQTPESFIFQFDDREIRFCRSHQYFGPEASRQWSSTQFTMGSKEVETVKTNIEQQKQLWLANLYFLWHRRKSRYEEELGAFHGRLDDEAECLAGRLDQLITGPGGGGVRSKIDRFMDSVIPGIGGIGIKRTEAESGGKTTIRVVFSNAREDRTLDELGGGVEQILALGVVLLGEKDEGALFIEEPESHLHESAQRRLIEQIVKHRGKRQIFVATHSPVFVNEFPDANVYRVTRGPNGDATVHTCVDQAAQREVLNDLGVLPSSLTQTNCVIWVEGPTETRLVRHWLGLVASELKVHQHYEFAMSGGSNIVSLAADVPTVGGEHLHDIMRICRHNFMICDRDAGIGALPAKIPVQAIEDLVGEHYWITHGYEIEWYIPLEIIAAIWTEDVSAHMAACTNADEPFYERLATSNVRGTKSPGEHKVATAERFIAVPATADTWFTGAMGADLRTNIQRVAAFIRQANQMVSPATFTCETCGQPTTPH